MKKTSMFATLVACSFCSTSHATLIGFDTFTRDDRTGLDWLRVTATQGWSMNQVLSGAGGWVQQGWRYATAAEIEELAWNLGGAEGEWTNSMARGLMMNGALGVTYTADATELNPPITSTMGFYDDGNRDGRAGLAEFLTTGWGPNPQPVPDPLNPDLLQMTSARWTTLDDAWFTDARLFSAGSFLVRQVPEPSMFVLLLGGAATARWGLKQRREAQ